MSRQPRTAATTPTPRIALALLAGGLVLGLAGPAAATSGAAPRLVSPAQATPERHVVAGETGAVLLNLPDDKGRKVLEVPAGTPLAVHPSRPGTPYLRVAAPGGVKVWVYGKYLQATSRPGWVEVTGSYVNMRPMPRSQDSYPLGQLDRGERLQVIARADASLPMAEDWVQVWSPAGTLAYVLAAETVSPPAGQDGAALFRSAGEAAVAARPVSGAVPAAPRATTPATTPTAEAEAPAASGVQARASNITIHAELNAANRAMDEAITLAANGGPRPDYAALRAAYVGVLAMGPDAPTRSLAEQRLAKLEAHRELDDIRREIEAASVERQKQLEELRAEAERNLNQRDPLWGRFQSRGWLERQTKDGKVVYLVRWGSDFLAQVQCSSGRYELELYDGFEVGVQGMPAQPAAGAAGSYPVIEVDRIEVISARL
jgi:hypothetical protein